MNDNNKLRSRQQIISKLAEARHEKQMSQAELASLIGTQRSNICRIESGSQNLSLDMLIKISEALGKDVNIHLEERKTEMNNCYSLRLYDDEILTFTLEEKGLEGLKAYIKKAKEQIKIVFIRCSKPIRRLRMIERDDDLECINARLIYDDEIFNDEVRKLADLIIDTSNSNVFDDATKIYEFYKNYI